MLQAFGRNSAPVFRQGNDDAGGACFKDGRLGVSVPDLSEVKLHLIGFSRVLPKGIVLDNDGPCVQNINLQASHLLIMLFHWQTAQSESHSL